MTWVNFLAKELCLIMLCFQIKIYLKLYQVSGYPTMYLLDENGIILHANAGYGESTEKLLEKIILENLD
jgi:hypothetical protein